jgi:hypothetical protein
MLAASHIPGMDKGFVPCWRLLGCMFRYQCYTMSFDKEKEENKQKNGDEDATNESKVGIMPSESFPYQPITLVCSTSVNA